MVNKFANVHIIVTDILPKPTNLECSQITYLIQDANTSWTHPAGCFDLVHIRELSGYIRDRLRIFQLAFICLKEGGYLEVCDIALPGLSATSQTAQDIGLQRGYDFDIVNPETCQLLMKQAGF